MRPPVAMPLEETITHGNFVSLIFFESCGVCAKVNPGHSSGEALQEMERLASQLPRGFGFDWSGQSLQELQSAVAKYPSDTGSLTYLGDAYLATKDTTKAMATTDRARFGVSALRAAMASRMAELSTP